MAKKKKGNKKKKKKEKNAKKVEVDEFPELNELTIGHLEGMIPALEEELDTIQQKRNYMQLERDQVATFYEITKRDTKKLDLEIDDVHRHCIFRTTSNRVEKSCHT